MIDIIKISKIFGKHRSLPFFLSMMEELFNYVDKKEIKKVAEIGFEDTNFLEIFNYLHNIEGFGVEIDKKYIDLKNKANKYKNLIYLDYYEFIKQKNIDLIYSQETLYNISNLEIHFYNMYSLLRDNGYYIFTIGNHLQHKLWVKRRDKVKEDNLYEFVCDYSIDEIADIANQIGFRVEVKILPFRYFGIYKPSFTSRYSNSMFELIEETTENKFLFFLQKE